MEKGLAAALPLPVFTFIIALIDGFNPCNLMVLTMLLALMLSESNSRSRIYAVGYSFVFVVFVFYFLFMTLWLNIFDFIGFIAPLRIAIALIAIIAGLINIKELFFFRKGVTLMVQDRHVGPLKRKITEVAKSIRERSILALIAASLTLGIFASLVELPCTAGFPIIYTGILSGMDLNVVTHYLFLVLYNVVYVLPLLTIITIVGFTMHEDQISKDKMAIIKYIGGVVMVLLGIILLTNPALVGLTH